jgi:hypothetical protein
MGHQTSCRFTGPVSCNGVLISLAQQPRWEHQSESAGSNSSYSSSSSTVHHAVMLLPPWPLLLSGLSA